MKWSNKLLQNLRWLALAVGGVTTATLGASAAVGYETGTERSNILDDEPVLLPNTLNATADDRYAAHRSHRSHSSHRSHRSSSGGRGRSVPSTPAPQPKYIPPPPLAPSTPSTTPNVIPKSEQRPLKPTPKDLSMMVVRVQAALMRRGYYSGDIDGRLGPETRAALYAFQEAQGIARNGRMNIETLTRLGISIP